MADTNMKKHGSNYSTEKDLCIARAYVHVSTDSIAGIKQNQQTYYSRIYSSYKGNKPVEAPLRKKPSIESRVKDIQRQCLRFFGCFGSFKAMKLSGVSKDDDIRFATSFFSKRKVKHSNEDVGRGLKYLEAW